MKHAPGFRRSGFTLVEVMLVVVIAGLLAMLALPAYQKLRRNSSGRAMILDARNIGMAMRQIALEHPKAAHNGATFTMVVAGDGSLSNAVTGSGDDVIAADKIAQLITKISSGTDSPITYTFGAGAGEKAFSISQPHCAPSDVIRDSQVNHSTRLGMPVQFDREGNPL